jgi:hypothetical protein
MGRQQTDSHRINKAAAIIGADPDVYRANIEAGGKWCTAHAEWHPVSEFGRDKSRGDGLAATCRNGVNERRKSKRIPAE